MLKRTLSIVLCLVFALCTLSISVFASDELTVFLRIEGIDSCLYYSDVVISEGDTVFDVIMTADAEDDAITVTATNSQYGSYITAINGITAGSYTTLKWDGWLFMVDGKSPSVGADAFELKGGETVVVYYGDPYNTGMQYPIVSFDAENGTFTLTSLDTVYDENWNAVTKECPVSGYTLMWRFSEYEVLSVTADENGVAVIPKEYLTYGSHNVQYSKTAANGLPLILRAAPDFSVEIPDNRSVLKKIIDAILNFFNTISDFFNTLFA